MTSRRLAPLVLAISLAIPAAVTPTAAWSPRTRVRMVEDARKLMPRALREVLARHEREIRRGMLTPMTAEGSPAHLPPWQGGTLDAEIVARGARVTAAVDGREPFSVVALRFGELAHFVADAAFPPLAGGSGDEARYAHFSSLVDDRLDKIPLVFYGHGDPMLERGDAAAFARAVLERAREEDSELARAYEAAGPDPHPSAFDDRSVPFAVASLAYSRTVTRIVNAWLDAWQRAHGDLGRTPYLDPDNPPRALERP
jgi:hypothetical protein